MDGTGKLVNTRIVDLVIAMTTEAARHGEGGKPARLHFVKQQSIRKVVPNRPRTSR